MEGYARNFPTETGAIRKSWKNRIRVALIYPNIYQVGMSNLGFQTVYGLINRTEGVLCERFFLPDSQRNRFISAESGRQLHEFDIIAFSISFEHDYLNVLKILQSASIPLTAEDRNNAFPLVICGGIACFLNPEPISPFIDCFLIGEAEALLPHFFTAVGDIGARHPPDKQHLLSQIARYVPGAYVPSFYRVSYHSEGPLSSFEPICGAPKSVTRQYVKDLSQIPAHTVVLSSDTAFPGVFLIETGRGCSHGCRFCSAGFVYRPPRFRPVSDIEDAVRDGMTKTNRIGLVGAAVSDLPGLYDLCMKPCLHSTRISFSSLRSDALTPDLISVLRRSDVKTATIAPDAGSERMRRIINKGVSEDDVLDAAEKLVSGGVPNIKLYFMIGLPEETSDDVQAVVDLSQKVRRRFSEASRRQGKIGIITVAVNCFVPKPATPFQWAGTDQTSSLKKKLASIQKGLKQTPNLRVHADAPRHAVIQALLSRSDRRVSALLLAAHNSGGNWNKAVKDASDTPGFIHPEFYVHRLRPFDEMLPWDFIDHGFEKDYLIREYQRALQVKTTPPCPMEKGCDRCGVCSRQYPP